MRPGGAGVVVALCLSASLSACQSDVGNSNVANSNVGNSNVGPAARPADFTQALTVARVGVVTPDAGLSAFMSDLAVKAARPRPPGAPPADYADVAAAFAPHVAVFSRGLDPTQAWFRVKTGNRPPFDQAVDYLVEQGELMPGATPPDYRPDLMQALAGALSSRLPLGNLPELPGAVCTDARLAFDAAAVRRFAEEDDLDAASIQFYPDDRPLLAAPVRSAGVIGVMPAQTLFMSRFPGTAKDYPDGWTQVTTSNGVRGWAADRGDDYRGLSQQHICFAKVGGDYRIVGLFAYGL